MCIIVAVLLCLMEALSKWAAVLQFSLQLNPIFPYNTHGWILALQLSPSCHVPARPILLSSPAALLHTTCCCTAKCLQSCTSTLVALLVLFLMALEQDLLAVTDTSTQGNNAKCVFIQLRIKMGACLTFAASANPA